MPFIYIGSDIVFASVTGVVCAERYISPMIMLLNTDISKLVAITPADVMRIGESSACTWSVCSMVRGVACIQGNRLVSYRGRHSILRHGKPSRITEYDLECLIVEHLSY
jgi:hypothetical protein